MPVVGEQQSAGTGTYVQDAGYPFGHQGGDTPDAASGYPFGECTDGVSRYLQANFQVKIPPNLGNATDWPQAMGTLGWAVNQQAQVNAIACWSQHQYPDFGHVAVVVALDPLQVFELNFAYPVESDAGHADLRTLRAGDPQPVAFGMAQGVTAGQNPNSNTAPNSDQGSSDPLGLGLIATAISNVGNTIEAEATIAKAKAVAMTEVGAGLIIMTGGGAALVLGALGHNPATIAAGVRSGVRQGRSAVTTGNRQAALQGARAARERIALTRAEASWRREQAANARVLAGPTKRPAVRKTSTDGALAKRSVGVAARERAIRQTVQGRPSAGMKAARARGRPEAPPF